MTGSAGIASGVGTVGSRRPLVTQGRRATIAAAVVGAGVAAILGGCSGSGPATAAERGRQVYQANCTSCHATDPVQNGPLGPAVKGSSRELLEARILHAGYPAGYTPKRSTTVMPPLPNLAASIADLAAFLQP